VNCWTVIWSCSVTHFIFRHQTWIFLDLFLQFFRSACCSELYLWSQTLLSTSRPCSLYIGLGFQSVDYYATSATEKLILCDYQANFWLILNQELIKHEHWRCWICSGTKCNLSELHWVMFMVHLYGIWKITRFKRCIKMQLICCIWFKYTRDSGMGSGLATCRTAFAVLRSNRGKTNLVLWYMDSFAFQKLQTKLSQKNTMDFYSNAT
jgi:hypothetical protein